MSDHYDEFRLIEPSPVTLSRNQRYEVSQKDKGLVKRTFWIPADRTVEIKECVDFLLSQPDMIPYMCRSIKTGKFAKIV